MKNTKHRKSYSLRCDRPATEGMLRALPAMKKQPVADRRWSLTDRPAPSPGRSTKHPSCLHPCPSVSILAKRCERQSLVCNIDARRCTPMTDQDTIRGCGCHRKRAAMPSTLRALRAMKAPPAVAGVYPCVSCKKTRVPGKKMTHGIY